MAAGVIPEERWREGRHDPPLPLPAAEQLMPLFECPRNLVPLERCMSFDTSSANECLHSIIWSWTPKAILVSWGAVKIANALGVVQFSHGGQVLLDVINAVINLPESLSSQFAVVTANMDRRRLRQGVETSKEKMKSSRKLMRWRRLGPSPRAMSTVLVAGRHRANCLCCVHVISSYGVFA